MKFFFCAIFTCILFAVACNKNDTPKITVPTLTTAAITNITGPTAMGGGSITSNGGETITASGICWSTTNQNPNVSDDTAQSNIASGSFTAMLTNLNLGSVYYVRAFATSRSGTGYGNVVTFNSGNGAPTATSLAITGNGTIGAELTATYVYSDPESDPESGSIIKWYIANNLSGAGETAIAGATQLKYTLISDHQGKFIRFGITPKPSSGNPNGIEVKSAFMGAIGETVTFTYNSNVVTYNILTSAATGKKWLDRNIGASRPAQSLTDYLSYGDLFQWGRLADGHQLITRSNSTDAGSVAVSGVTTVHSTTDVPSTNQFISLLGKNDDWRATPNDNLWQGSNGVNNPCPAGWRIATEAEWVAEGITTIEDGYAKLKLTYTGYRNSSTAMVGVAGSFGLYWTSSISGLAATRISFSTDESTKQFQARGDGLACRCTMN